jgi:hypothetical protein
MIESMLQDARHAARVLLGSPGLLAVSVLSLGETALGKRIRRSEREAFAEIVGIVADTKYGSITEAPTPLYYAAYTQRPHISSQFRPL